MGISVFFLSFSIFLCRAFFTSYKNRESKEPYVVIKSKIFSKLLIDGWSPFDRKNSSKQDRNKLSIYGLIGYFVNFIGLVLLTIFCIVPEIACNTYEVIIKGDTFILDSINEIVVFIVIITIFLLEISFLLIKSIVYFRKQQLSKTLKNFIIIMFCIAIIVCIACEVGILISAFI